MRYILEAEDLCKTYEVGNQSKVAILKNINLRVKEGEPIAVMGASGSGKSTLLYQLSGMDRVTSGRAIYDGQVLADIPAEALARLRLLRMGFIFQKIHFLKHLSVRDNILLPAYLGKGHSQNDVDRRAGELMKAMGIAGLEDRDITQVSGGQLQRAGICRALMNHPDIIFGDEPTGALNSKSTHEILDILLAIHRTGTTILLVTHDTKVAAKAERVLFMVDGQIMSACCLGRAKEKEGNWKAREEQLVFALTKMGL